MSATQLAEGPVRIDGRELRLSNLDKVLYPKTGTTKAEVLEYYRAVAAVLLPRLAGRPLTMKRYPDGVEGPHFYEKQCPPWRPDWVSTAPVWTERKQRNIDFCVIDDLATLLWAVNLADLEMHALLATVDDLQRPTMVVFDLDPGEGVGLAECAEVAVWLRDVLDHLDLTALVKSSGSKGLHLAIPLNTVTTYEETKPFAKALARLAERERPGEVVSVMTKAKRRGKVFVDWSQNTAHKTTVVPFSLRARERPTVAVPLRWSEVEAVAAGKSAPDNLLFVTDQVVDQLEPRGALAEPLLTKRQRMPNLEEMFG